MEKGFARLDGISHKAWKICMGILLLFSLFVALFLAYYSVRFSYVSSTDYSRPVYIIRDCWWLNLLFFALLSAVSLFLGFLFQKLGSKQRLAGYLFLGLCCILYVIAGMVWAENLHYYPSGDQLNTTAGAYYNLQGNFIMLIPTGYIGKFPYQKGLMFLYEILFSVFGDFCYPVAARFHIGMGVATMIFGYLFVEETFRDSVCKVLYCSFLLLCAPYLILTPYAYGDLPSVCFCTVLFWAVLRLSRTSKLRYLALACCMSPLALMVRMHSWIAIIAVVIGMALWALQKRRLVLPLASALLIVLSAQGALELLDYSYEVRSGYERTQGAPFILTIAMGLQDNPGGPGTYNNYQTETMGLVDFDVDAAAEIGRENIRESLQGFWEDSDRAVTFFKTKLQMQWIEPLFETLITMNSLDDEAEIPDWVQDIFYGSSHDSLIRFADVYQSVAYLGFLIFVFALVKRRQEDAAFYIPLIAIVGGFLFSIIWEAQCRYVLPYYVFMLLYVPEGIVLTGRALWKCGQWAMHKNAKVMHKN